jgi:hypothetical protein
VDQPVPSDSSYGPTALPSTGARVAAFMAILVGGLCGGLIGFAFTDLQGASTIVSGIFAVIGALIGAVGVGIVAVLALRASGEWREIERRRDG